jgi:hypothetical protein
VIDKVIGTFRTGEDMPVRRLDQDALNYCALDQEDTITVKYPGLPSILTLSADVTQPGMFFDPRTRGFYYVEAYDPAYWIAARQINQQSCFHPMYRMKARSTRSPLNNTPVALWVNKYSGVTPSTAAFPGIAARSVHFGLPLWFFRHSAVDSIADVVFEEWGLTGD